MRERLLQEQCRGEDFVSEFFDEACVPMAKDSFDRVAFWKALLNVPPTRMERLKETMGVSFLTSGFLSYCLFALFSLDSACLRGL